jgi:hypothetical protein
MVLVLWSWLPVVGPGGHQCTHQEDSQNSEVSCNLLHLQSNAARSQISDFGRVEAELSSAKISHLDVRGSIPSEGTIFFCIVFVFEKGLKEKESER